jgi:uncharacterized protein GlcG (DUF336 family)
MSVFAFRSGVLALGCSLVPALAQPASARLIIQKSLSPAMVVTMAQTAMETCKANGYRVSVTVLGNAGEVLIQLRGEGVGPHTVENSQPKSCQFTGVYHSCWSKPSADRSRRFQASTRSRVMELSVVAPRTATRMENNTVAR